MCLNLRKVRNKYTGKELYVPCGHCPACQQEKAARRASRIRNNSQNGTLCLFVTLTYDRTSIPVVFREDIELRKSHLNVYRLSHSRRVRLTDDYKIGVKRKYELRKIGEYDDVVYHDLTDNFDIPTPAKLSKKYVGVCFFKDVQDFFKRLTKYVNYHLSENENRKYSYFVTTEYGETTYRSHIHALLFVPSHLEAFYRKAIDACWPFADRRRTNRYVQVARDAASYVASYVNCDADFPAIYKTKKLRQKSSMSKHFGAMLECFQLASLLEKTDSGTLTYVAVTNRDGLPVLRECAIPQYVISRYFPRYKGYSQRSDVENIHLIAQGFRGAYVPDASTYEMLNYATDYNVEVATSHLFHSSSPIWIDDDDSFFFPMDYTDFPQHLWSPRNNYLTAWSPDELRKYRVMIDNCFKEYHRLTGKNRYDYAIDFVRVWRCYKSTCYRLFMVRSEDNHFIDCYDNVIDYVTGKVHSISLDEYGLGVTSLDPNEFVLNKEKTMRLVETYELKKKKKKITNYIMAANGHWV